MLLANMKAGIAEKEKALCKLGEKFKIKEFTEPYTVVNEFKPPPPVEIE